MCSDGGTDLGAVAGHHVEYATGKDVRCERGQPERSERRDLRRLQDDRVPRGERGADLPAGRNQGIVPWRDLASYADRLAADERGRAADVLPGGLSLRHSARASHET